eukprot:TRINITY_DN15858_c0_g1_i1.p1 TRINITY_DN15858_c0_g1~~TRINITY_DN15858_c0_g1_i1.p1  ORF type:complete len:220 (+),score=58.49 TRINITY_DN15858_c0_g1_i1:3-662(+)
MDNNNFYHNQDILNYDQDSLSLNIPKVPQSAIRPPTPTNIQHLYPKSPSILKKRSYTELNNITSPTNFLNLNFSPNTNSLSSLSTYKSGLIDYLSSPIKEFSPSKFLCDSSPSIFSPTNTDTTPNFFIKNYGDKPFSTFSVDSQENIENNPPPTKIRKTSKKLFSSSPEKKMNQKSSLNSNDTFKIQIDNFSLDNLDNPHIDNSISSSNKTTQPPSTSP